MTNILDIYSIKARLFPAFLLLLPIPLAAMAWLPSANFPVLSLSGFGIAAGLSFFLAEIARDAGKAKEPSLFRVWGGTPTTQLLRHQNKGVNASLRERWHKRIEALTGCKLPSAAKEARSPEEADALYEAAIYELRERRRHAEAGSLFFKENVSYGFRRNLWG